MACRLVGAKPLSEPMLDVVNWTLKNKLQWNSNLNSYIFIQENASENVVCEIAPILSWPQCVNETAPAASSLPTRVHCNQGQTVHYGWSWYMITANGQSCLFNSLRPRWNKCHFADDIFKYIFLNENVLSLIEISLKFIPKGPINNTPALVQIMACRRPGDKPLPEPIMIILLTHICVTRPQWVNSFHPQCARSVHHHWVCRCVRT